MSTVKKQGNKLATWDFRYNASTFTSETELIELLSGIAKKFVFQEEQSDNGYRHYQGRLSLIKARRLEEKHIVLKLFKDKPPNYINPTVNVEVMKGDSFYLIKEDTRVNGPWTDQDEIKVQTVQLKEFLKFEMYEWQRQIFDMSTVYNGRKIDLVYDPNGNIGKSILSEYLEYMNLAEEIPPFRLMDDIFQWVASRPIKKAYLVDMPRGMKKDKLGDFYSGLEVIKNGVAYDKRYKAQKIRFDRPRVFVFTNTLPQFKLMSRDRWNVWEINQELGLQPYTVNVSPISDTICNITINSDNELDSESDGE